MFEEVASQLGIPLWLLIILLIWTLFWKAAALWKSARLNQPVWFILLLLINTFGILEIVYIFLISRIDMNNYSKSQIRSSKKVTRSKRK
jgi:hypothetical protein